MKKTLLILAILAVIAIVLLRCSHGKTSGAVDTAAIDTSFNINFNPYPPTDLDSRATTKQLSEFAWEEFLALNWKSSFSKDGKRDHPDTTWTYQNEPGAYPSLDVWETFAHRTELRPYSNKMIAFDSLPHYSFGDKLQPANPATSFTLFNSLDENNEIGSCNLFAHVDTFNKKYQVLYEAKVNRYEYEYINKYYPDTTTLHSAVTNTMTNIAKFGAYYQKGVTNTCSCPVNANVICLPCGGGKFTGTMEIKAGWRRLTSLDDSSKFFTRKVIYYTKNAAGQVIYNNVTYALIALHIIHKTQNYPDFIFATWEHIGVEHDHMAYQLLTGNGQDSGKLTPPSRDPILSITAAATNYVHSKLPSKSIWQNYRLVGVQATPTSDSTSANFFLSNYAVESDTALSHFNGSGIGTPHNHLANILYKGNFYSMGGCQGCHGAGQKSFGTDFSFLLDNVGKPVKDPDIGDANPTLKFKRFSLAFASATHKILTITKGKTQPIK